MSENHERPEDVLEAEREAVRWEARALAVLALAGVVVAAGNLPALTTLGNPVDHPWWGFLAAGLWLVAALVLVVPVRWAVRWGMGRRVWVGKSRPTAEQRRMVAGRLSEVRERVLRRAEALRLFELRDSTETQVLLGRSLQREKGHRQKAMLVRVTLAERGAETEVTAATQLAAVEEVDLGQRALLAAYADHLALGTEEVRAPALSFGAALAWAALVLALAAALAPAGLGWVKATGAWCGALCMVGVVALKEMRGHAEVRGRSAAWACTGFAALWAVAWAQKLGPGRVPNDARMVVILAWNVAVMAGALWWVVWPVRRDWQTLAEANELTAGKQVRLLAHGAAGGLVALGTVPLVMGATLLGHSWKAGAMLAGIGAVMMAMGLAARRWTRYDMEELTGRARMRAFAQAFGVEEKV